MGCSGEGPLLGQHHGDPAVWGHCCVQEHWERWIYFELFPPHRVISHHVRLHVCFYQWDYYTQPPGSPSQMCWVGIELGRPQGEASGKFLCSGWRHKGRLSPQLPPPARSLLSSTSLPPAAGLSQPCLHGEMSPSAAETQLHPHLAADTHPPGPECPHVGQLAVPHLVTPRCHPMGCKKGCGHILMPPLYFRVPFAE